jgi:hypothetical protein
MGNNNNAEVVLALLVAGEVQDNCASVTLECSG